ncbi:TRAP transporter small permease [Desulfobaculum senezii]|jgi:TRAP-type C4-dicarboxylate transport system permease small subunit|uniref:TRAP transporter small permease subunit n=1 Tax=Desulfobaculum sp. SPO524 TaxID=3378071 RepID=UPI0038530FCD
MSRLIAALERLSVGGALLSAVFMGLTVLLIVVEILLRATSGASTFVASEYSGYFLVAIVVFGLGFTLKEEAHIRITLLHSRLSARWRKVVDVVVALTSMALTMYILVYSVQLVYETYSLEMTADTISETPLWIPQCAIPLGLAVFLLQFVAFIAGRVRK